MLKQMFKEAVIVSIIIALLTCVLLSLYVATEYGWADLFAGIVIIGAISGGIYLFTFLIFFIGLCLLETKKQVFKKIKLTLEP